MANLHTAMEHAQARVVIGDLPAVVAHEVAVVEVFQNLVANALKYRGERPLVIEVNGHVERAICEFSVSDNGAGIPPEYHGLIFGMFKRLEHGPESGTGIGLALCRKIVERYQGRIWVESEPGCGSTFRFTLPAATPAKAVTGGS